MYVNVVESRKYAFPPVTVFFTLSCVLMYCKQVMYAKDHLVAMYTRDDAVAVVFVDVGSVSPQADNRGSS